MNRADLKWIAIGAIGGLWTAYKTLNGHFDNLTAPLMIRATSNVIGGIIGMLLIVYLVRWAGKPKR